MMTANLGVGLQGLLPKPAMMTANLGVGLQGLQLQLGTMCEMVGLQGLQLQVASMSANVGEGLQEQLLLLGQVLGRALDLTKVQAYTSLLQITISVFATMNCRTRQRRWLPYRPACFQSRGEHGSNKRSHLHLHLHHNQAQDHFDTVVYIQGMSWTCG